MKLPALATLLLTWSAQAQTFIAADVHPSPKAANPFVRTSPVHNGRYQIRNATMVDLVRIGYGVDADKVYGGPNWLELDRFDITGKVAEDSTPESHKQMLQALLEDRFELKTHRDSKPLPVYVLTAGKKPLLKEAAGTEEPGCKPEPAGSGPPVEGTTRLMVSLNGNPMSFALGPGRTVTYHCRNLSMTAFAANLKTMFGTSLGAKPLTDETGIKGNWNFDLRYSLQLIGPIMQDTAGTIPLAEAIEKQLGLKLEERQVPTPVLVVDSVNRTPSPNPPGTADALPPIPIPTEFEVATIKPIQGGMGQGPTMMRFQMQPGGRFVSEGMPLQFLINRAFNTNNNDMIAGMPSFAQSDRYDLIAKVPGDTDIGPLDNEALAPLLLHFLKERFRLQYHTEERDVTAYALTAGKPKLKKSDPASRIGCKNPPAPPTAPPGSRYLTCQNVTMAQFAERLQNMSFELNWPVVDATGLEGTWDLALTFTMGRPNMPMMVAVRPPEGGGPASPDASDPSGGITIFAAVEKQLGLKLEKEKRKATIFVIDHIEQHPTEN